MGQYGIILYFDKLFPALNIFTQKIPELAILSISPCFDFINELFCDFEMHSEKKITH